MRTMQEYHAISQKLAHQILRNGTDTRTNLETATALIGHVLAEERAQLRSEVIVACAELAEEQYAHPDWDRPVYSATGCGKWIGACIRSKLNGARMSNVEWKPKIKRTKKRKEDDTRTTESDESIASVGSEDIT